MDENQFWIAVWRLVGTCFCVVAVSVVGCTVNQHRIIVSAAKDGKDPLAVSCAMTANAVVCSVAGRSK